MQKELSNFYVSSQNDLRGGESLTINLKTVDRCQSFIGLTRKIATIWLAFLKTCFGSILFNATYFLG